MTIESIHRFLPVSSCYYREIYPTKDNIHVRVPEYAITEVAMAQQVKSKGGSAHSNIAEVPESAQAKR